MLAASHAVQLSHVNAGVVLYHVARMRARAFEEVTLQAARDMQQRNAEASCLRDQSLINTRLDSVLEGLEKLRLHSFREVFGYLGPSPVLLLPCRWSVFPTTEWLSYWNSLEMWLPELRERRRYPGMLSRAHFEVYCPDDMDILSAWAAGRRPRVT